MFGRRAKTIIFFAEKCFECSQILIIKEIYFWFEIKRARTMIENVLISIFYFLRAMLGWAGNMNEKENSERNHSVLSGLQIQLQNYSNKTFIGSRYLYDLRFQNEF